jgi:hypothetical protein
MISSSVLPDSGNESYAATPRIIKRSHRHHNKPVT